MEVKGNQNIFDFTLEKFGTLENLFNDVLVPNNLPVDQETQTNQEININAVGKGDDDVKMKISEQGLSMGNGDIPIIVNYSNGIVTNSVFGKTAIFDFDVIANFSGAVTFTVNWGAQVGTTIINATLVSGVSQSLQTSIEIPLGVGASQTVNVTDTLGGSYAVPYTVENEFPTDAIHEYLFSNNLLDTGSIVNNLTQSSGVIADVMTTDRHGTPDRAMRSNNSLINLHLGTEIDFQKGWSLNWFQLVDSPGSGNANILFRFGSARFARFSAGSQVFAWRPSVGTSIEVSCADYLPNVWQNFHVAYGNGTMEVFINNVSQGTANNTDHTTPLFVWYISSASASVTDVSKDDIRIFSRLLSSSERQAITDS